MGCNCNQHCQPESSKANTINPIASMTMSMTKSMTKSISNSSLQLAGLGGCYRGSLEMVRTALRSHAFNRREAKPGVRGAPGMQSFPLAAISVDLVQAADWHSDAEDLQEPSSPDV